MTRDESTLPVPEHTSAQAFIDSLTATNRTQAADLEAARKENMRLRQVAESLLAVAETINEPTLHDACLAARLKLCTNDRTRQMLDNAHWGS